MRKPLAGAAKEQHRLHNREMQRSKQSQRDDEKRAAGCIGCKRKHARECPLFVSKIDKLIARVPRINVMGQPMTVDEAAMVANVDRIVILARIEKGMSGDEAVFYSEARTPF